MQKVNTIKSLAVCLAEATESEDDEEELPNPHDSHEGEIECNKCHIPHGESVSYCGPCHGFGLVVP